MGLARVLARHTHFTHTHTDEGRLRAQVADGALMPLGSLGALTLGMALPASGGSGCVTAPEAALVRLALACVGPTRGLGLIV